MFSGQFLPEKLKVTNQYCVFIPVCIYVRHTYYTLCTICHKVIMYMELLSKLNLAWYKIIIPFRNSV